METKTIAELQGNFFGGHSTNLNPTGIQITMPDCKVFRKIQASEITEDQYGKAKNFRFFSLARPHMRSLHASWSCFFIAFLSWFGIQPLLPTISKELNLSKVDIANSGIASVAATICVRIIVGPLCDRFGPRRLMAFLLIIGSIPMALSGLIKNGTGLIIIRLCVGILGGSFVPCQFWTTAMFNAKIVGTANAIVGGWGNLGGGATFLFMPAVFELVKLCGAHEFLAWKIAVAIPAVITLSMGLLIWATTDDCPQGMWHKRKLPDKSGTQDKNLPLLTDDVTSHEGQSTCRSTTMLKILSSFILFVHYGCCFGIELAMNNVVNLFLLYNFQDEECLQRGTSINNNTEIIYYPQQHFQNISDPAYRTNATQQWVKVEDDFRCSILSQNSASLIASLFGLMNLFARSLGGIASDLARKYCGIPGRILVHFLCLFLVGLLMVTFGQMKTIPSAVAVLIFFSTFVQMTEGTTYALVPYVFKSHVGKVAGLVGAGGNSGAVLWNFIWSRVVETDQQLWFLALGITIMACSALSFFISLEGEFLWHIFSSRQRQKHQRKEKRKR